MNNRSNTTSTESDRFESRNNIINCDRVERILNRIFFLRVLGVCTYMAHGYIKQDNDIGSSLESRGAEVIEGFVDVDVKGFVFNISPDSVYSAIVKLDTCGTCDIKFTALANDRQASSMFVDQVEIADFGNCPLTELD